MSNRQTVETEQVAAHLQWLAHQSKMVRHQQTGALILRLVQISLQLVSFWLFADIMHRLIVTNQAIDITTLTVFTTVSLAYVIFFHLSQRQQNLLAQNCERRLYTELTKSWSNGQVALIRHQPTYHWQQLVLEHIPAVSRFLAYYQVQKLLAVLSILLVLIAIAPVNYFVAGILLITLPVVPMFMILVGKGAASLHRKYFDALEKLGNMFSDRLKALTLLTTTNQHAAQQKRLALASDAVNMRTMKVVSVAFLSSTVLDFFSTISIALVAVFVGFTLLGEIHIGPAMNFHQGLYMLLVSPMLFAQMKTLGSLYHQKAQADAAAQKLTPVYTPVPEKQYTNNFSGLNWINFSMVQPNLHAQNLQLGKGQWVRLSGDSGAGKTVFMEALMGFRNASHALNIRAAMLGQQAIILPGSIRQNLSMEYDVPEHKLWEVLEKVQLTEWAKQQVLQLDTKMGDYPPMSGGEAQRLALARVMLQAHPVVLLDEPTAHLTDQQHRQLSQLIHQHLSSTTVIWASHKPLPEQWFDRHWNIKQGEVVSQ